MLIPRVPSKMCCLVSVLEVIIFATAVSSLCPEGAFSSVKESKETCITLHTVGKSTRVVLSHSLTLHYSASLFARLVKVREQEQHAVTGGQKLKTLDLEESPHK